MRHAERTTALEADPPAVVTFSNASSKRFSSASSGGCILIIKLLIEYISITPVHNVDETHATDNISLGWLQLGHVAMQSWFVSRLEESVPGDARMDKSSGTPFILLPSRVFDSISSWYAPGDD